VTFQLRLSYHKEAEPQQNSPCVTGISCGMPAPTFMDGVAFTSISQGCSAASTRKSSPKYWNVCLHDARGREAHKGWESPDHTVIQTTSECTTHSFVVA
jgi:hypothetical protein